ncbi:MAG: type II toxin-antitoxin system VapC family toxin [Microbacterium sp.]
MIVLDANVLIALLDPDDVHHEPADRFVDAHLGQTLAASVLTLAEALVRPAMRGVAGETERRFDAFGLQVIEVPGDVAAAVARVRAESGLRMPDAVVVFTAERLGAALATTDATVARAASARAVVVHAL